MADFLEIGALIEQRIKDAGIDVYVGGASDLASLTERAQPDRAAYVIYAGFTPGASNGPGVRSVTQRWMVTVCVRNVRGIQSGEGVRNDAGPLIHQIVALLMGWRPSASYDFLALEPSPAPYFGDGVGYFPIMFSTKTTIRGVQ